MHPWVVLVGAHGHQRVGCRSTDWWDPETGAAMQCNEAALAHSRIARDCTGLHGSGWRGRMQQFGARCPPIVPAPPQPHQLTLEISLVCPTLSIFPSPHRNSTPPTTTLPCKSCKLELHGTKYTQCQAKPTQLPSLHSSQWRGG